MKKATRIVGVTCALVADPDRPRRRTDRSCRRRRPVADGCRFLLGDPSGPSGPTTRRHLADADAQERSRHGAPGHHGPIPKGVLRVRRASEVVKTDSDTTYRITFAPLSMTPELQQILGADAGTWRLLPAPRFPAPRVVRSGEVLQLTLLTNSAWGQQMSEYMTLQEPRRQGFDPEPPREFAFAVGAPRDFTAGDVELQLDRPQVTTAGTTTTFKSSAAARARSCGCICQDAAGSFSR